MEYINLGIYTTESITTNTHSTTRTTKEGSKVTSNTRMGTRFHRETPPPFEVDFPNPAYTSDGLSWLDLSVEEGAFPVRIGKQYRLILEEVE